MGLLLSGLLHAREDKVNDGFVFGENAGALWGNGVQLPCALGSYCRLTHLLEHCEHRIDDSGARSIGAAKLVLDRLDDLVSVTWALLDQMKDNEAEITGLEEASWASTTAASIKGAGWAAKMAFMVMAAEIKFKARTSMVGAVFVVGMVSGSHD